jgi:PhzF family phenazine biosynthesis protein
MKMCVHATVASVVFLGQQGELSGGQAAVETPLGIRQVTWDASGAMVEQFPPVFGTEVDPAPVVAALGLTEAAGPIRSVSTARSKLMIPVRDEDVLHGIEPDYELLWDVCDELDVTGCYPFAQGERITARQFPLRAGYPEDPATGVAACALGAHLAAQDPTPGWHRYEIHQGRAMGRPSLVVAESLVGQDLTVTATRVGGHSVMTSGSL